jgi:hypothetical protein
MQIIPNRRKDRILVRVTPYHIHEDKLGALDARPVQELPRFPRLTNGKLKSPYVVSIPVPPGKTKAMHVRTVRGKLKGLTGTIKWTRGQAS